MMNDSKIRIFTRMLMILLISKPGISIPKTCDEGTSCSVTCENGKYIHIIDGKYQNKDCKAWIDEDSNVVEADRNEEQWQNVFWQGEIWIDVTNTLSSLMNNQNTYTFDVTNNVMGGTDPLPTCKKYVEFNYECNCPNGWQGTDCKIPVCERNCHDNGNCIAPDNCQCNDGWTGNDCGVNRCSDKCPLHGECVADDTAGGWKCKCRDGYKGEDCLCPINGNGEECDGHGTCNPMFWNGENNPCNCNNGWKGAYCNFECPMDENGVECSGHGKCHWDSSDTPCRCDRGWEGKSCNVYSKVQPKGPKSPPIGHRAAEHRHSRYL